MKIYPLIREALFCLEAERAHHFSLSTLNRLLSFPGALPLLREIGILPLVPSCPTTLASLPLQGAVGLAAGLDKNAEYLPALFGLGFHFVEVGTATPLPQAGNPAPRLFRLPEYQAIINRMGFNNDGVHALAERVAHFRKWANDRAYPLGAIGINLGKNAQTPIANAFDDYRLGIRATYAVADYLTINISSPNTKNLRDLQGSVALRALLEPLMEAMVDEQQKTHRRIDLWVKVAPDLTLSEMELMAEVFATLKIDGLIATNTTLSREAVRYHRWANEAGGLSGAPLTQTSTDAIAKWRALLPNLPIIGVGGIMSATDAIAKRQAGANAVQLYSGFIYQGPSLIAEIAHHWAHYGIGNPSMG